MSRDLTVCQYDPPHHFRQDHLLPEVVLLSDGPSELVMINGLLPLRLRKIHQLTCGSVVQREMALQCRFDMGPFGRAELIISMRELEEHGTGS